MSEMTYEILSDDSVALGDVDEDDPVLRRTVRVAFTIHGVESMFTDPAHIEELKARAPGYVGTDEIQVNPFEERMREPKPRDVLPLRQTRGWTVVEKVVPGLSQDDEEAHAEIAAVGEALAAALRAREGA